MKIEAKYFSLQRLQIVKDIFIFSCYTGLAFVDIERLTDDNIRNGRLFIVCQGFTGKNVVLRPDIIWQSATFLCILS